MGEHMGAAQRLLDDPLLTEIFTDLERRATERAINAKTGDDETRRFSTMEVRAIRAVRRELEALAKAKTNPTPRPVV